MGLNILVTGGAGFVGANLVIRLIKEGHNVTVLDNLFTGRLEKLKEVEGKYKFINANVVHMTPDKFNEKYDQIFHLACPASPPAYQSDPLNTIDTCLIGTRNMLELARKCGAKMLYTSTSEVYGDPEISPQPETYWGRVNCRGPRSCYDEGKRAAEVYCMEYHNLKENPVDVKTARLFNTYGPLMSPDDGRVVSNFIMQALTNHDITIMGTGEQTRSFTYVDDTVDGLIRLINSNYYNPVNIGNPVEFSIKEFVTEVTKLIKTESKVIHIDAAIDDPKQRKPDITVARRELGWEPKVLLQEGLTKTIPYFKELVDAGYKFE